VVWEGGPAHNVCGFRFHGQIWQWLSFLHHLAELLGFQNKMWLEDVWGTYWIGLQTSSNYLPPVASFAPPCRAGRLPERKMVFICFLLT
jgi:hypothetical protein